MECWEEIKRKMRVPSPIIPIFHHSNIPVETKSPICLAANGAF
jgi:hypothetical protein